ncbi:hypothetical protein SPRG_10658 [Saprolegnia parasitica CBS 223.65]|uniref:MalT-like TPR region domain-containing protein n=1 Tax=Saprolegnia parasitica (strain CBS 223.65) TaxID=695850 RepID=A0A067CAW3_SAPPC|nr:hypothetical protein SPRG_10658 [Saprolegnia parasitica CBS 223.65]KDO23962.1 hypothetical protein SPRG_10658 [Saprolegnia parasitica CBS 223.65]|eukprot:XP_012205284.1 hypothetical protein SPRG_10658 [Saprolegnia parasitica CBS 223.65]
MHSYTKIYHPYFHALSSFPDPEGSEAVFLDMIKENPIMPATERWCIQTQIARTYLQRAKYPEGLAVLDAIEAEVAADDLKHKDEPTNPLKVEVRVRCLAERARILRDMKEKAKALPLLATAWTLVESVPAFPDEDLALDVLHLLAMLQNDHNDKISWNKRAFAMATKSTHPDATRWVAVLGDNLGWSYLETNHADDAVTHFEAALAARKAIGDAECIRLAKWMVARGLRAAKKNQDAIKVLAELETEYASIDDCDGYVCEEMAENLHELGQDEAAKPYFKKAWTALQNDSLMCEHHPEHRLERLHELGN